MGNVRMTICITIVAMTMMAGHAMGGLYLHDGKTYDIDFGLGDDVYVDVFPGAQTTVNLLDGGWVYWLRAYNNSRVTLSGGRIGGDDDDQSFVASDSCQATMTGGTIRGTIRLDSQATFFIYGTDFQVDGDPSGFGEITSILGGDSWLEPYRQLTGTLANGDLIDNAFRLGDNARIVLIPEPTTFLLLGLGGLAVFRRRTMR